MLKSIRDLSSSCCKDYKVIFRLQRWRIVKQNESNGDLELIATIGIGGKSASYWKTNKR